jgi:CheY-like chemotaxis protein
VVDLVGDGAQAVKRMEDTQPGTYDMILMDIMMPVMDGLEATRTIRSMEREDCKTIPIIAMSANAFDDDLKKSVECGMNGHLAKPVEIDKMYKLFQEILK